MNTGMHSVERDCEPLAILLSETMDRDVTERKK